MKLKEFLTNLKEAFFSMILNAVGSTVFLLLVVDIVLVCVKVLPWETILATYGLYGAKRLIQDSTLGAK